jgi:hypothetical protein
MILQNTPKDDTTPDDCVLPPPPLPAEDLARYSPNRDPDSEQDIARYVEIESHDEETVQNVELIKTEIIGGVKYQIWDVITDKDRWWVIDNATNLYSQKSFPSLDYTLSFHVGLMMRVRSQSSGADPTEPSPFDEVLRRAQQAEDLYDRAVEAEDFQAVGHQLRECLLSLLPAMRRRVTVADDIDQPKEGDFINWYHVLMDVLCPGDSNKELRQYLKHTAKDTWQLVGWLLHDRDANKTAASIASQACATVVGHSVQLLERHTRDFTETCPICKSRDIRSHFDPFLGEDGDYYYTCGSCRWSSHVDIDDEEDASISEAANLAERNSEN